MKITVLVDNIAHDNYQAEWGLAFYIEYGEKKVLLDTGSSTMFLENAEKMGIDLSEVDVAVLSHAHYDHGNGIGAFLDRNTKASFYIRKECACNCYNVKTAYIGLPLDLFDKYDDRLIKVDEDQQLLPGIYVVSHKTKNLDSIGKLTGLYIKVNNGYIPDDFAHEQSLVFETAKGLVIFNSCSHGGAMNILNEVKSAFPDKKVIAYAGGLHLFERCDEDILAIANDLKQQGIQVYTGHCTGQHAFDLMESVMHDQVKQFTSGFVFEFE